MQRLDDWPTLLCAEIERHRGRPFAWGEHDCATFCLDCLKAITGTDPLEHLRGSYSTNLGAALVLEDLGCENLEDLATYLLGEPKRVALAMRGDWILSPKDEPDALGVCMGANSVFLTSDGLTDRRTADCRHAWTAGE